MNNSGTIHDERPQLLFQSDFKRFRELMLNNDPQVRVEGLKTVDDLAICEIVRYGIYNDTGMVPDLREFYRRYVMRAPTERRTAIFEHVKGMVMNVSTVSANAFLPFIVEDNEVGIVATAVIDFVSLSPLTDNDPMTAPKYIVDMIRDGTTLQNEGAAFGALLHIGDPRVCKLIWPLRNALDADEIDQAVKCQTGLMSACTVDFYIDWLEGMEGDYPDGQFGSVTSGLLLLKRRSVTDQVSTGQPPFPVTGVSREEYEALTKPISLSDYLNRIAPRLYALERGEPPPRIMPHVLQEWGLTPQTDPSEIAKLSDRLRGVQ